MPHVQDLARVDRKLIRTIADRDYPDGVVSVYATVDFTDPTAVLTAVRNELKAAFSSAAAYAPADLAETLPKLARQIDEEIHLYLGEPPHHRAVAGFIDVAGKHDDEWMILEVPSVTHAWYGDHPVVTPLMRAVVEGAATGHVLATSDTAIVSEWRAGEYEEIDHFEMSVDSGSWRRKQGGAHGGGMTGAQRATQTDLFDRKLELESDKFLRDGIAPAMFDLAREMGWERLIAFGPAVLREAMGGTQTQLRFIDGGDAVLVHEPTDKLIARIDALVEADEAQRELDLVTSITSGSLVRAAMGAPSVERASEQANIETLVVATSTIEHGVDEVHAVEGLVRRTLRYGGTVLPVTGAASELLQDHDGVAATLRHA